jgi:hypothetical protein
MYVSPSTYQYNQQHMIGGGNYWGGAYYSPSNSWTPGTDQATMDKNQKVYEDWLNFQWRREQAGKLTPFYNPEDRQTYMDSVAGLKDWTYDQWAAQEEALFNKAQEGYLSKKDTFGKYPGFLAHHPQSAQWMAHNAWREDYLPGPGQAGYSGPSYTDEFGNLIQGTAAGFTAPRNNPLGGLGGLGSGTGSKPWTYKDSVGLLGGRGLSLGGRGL